jgi:hypothetical protein
MGSNNIYKIIQIKFVYLNYSSYICTTIWDYGLPEISIYISRKKQILTLSIEDKGT